MSSSSSFLSVAACLVATLPSYALGFVSPRTGTSLAAPRTSSFSASPSSASLSSSSALFAASDSAEEYVASNHPSFYDLLSRNADAMKKMRSSEVGFTIFAPSESSYAAMGEKKVEQLSDVRNTEMVEKMGAYHVIPEPVTSDMLFDSGGVISAGGELVVDRSTSGGFFGVGGSEDGGLLVNGARVVNSYNFVDEGPDGNMIPGGKFCVVHETDGLVSPSVLWRYADQLRIPGSN